MEETKLRDAHKTSSQTVSGDGISAVSTFEVTEDRVLVALDNGDIHLYTLNGEEGGALRGHSKAVLALATSEDTLASGSSDCDVRIWDLNSRECNQVLSGHTSTVRAIAWLPRNNTLVSASRDTLSRVWDLSQGEGECSQVLFGHQDTVRCIDTSGYLLVSGSNDSTARVWSIPDDFECLHILRGHTSGLLRVAVDSPRGLAVTAGSDASVRFWDTRSGQWIAIRTAHDEFVARLQLYNGSLLTADAAGYVCIWSLRPRKALIRRFHAHSDSVVSLDVVDRRLVTAGKDCTIKIWDLENGALVCEPEHTSEIVWGVAWLGREGLVALIKRDGNVIIGIPA